MTAGGIISILPAEKGLYPWSCTVETDVPFTGLGLKPQMQACISRTGVQVIEAGLTIDFNSAIVKNLDVFEVVSYKPPAQSCLPVLKALLLAEGNLDGMLPLALDTVDNPFSAMIRPRLTALHAAFKALDREKAASAATAIAGLGIGLTPSSDDMLLGYVCAYYPLGEAKGLKHEEVLALGRSACYAAAEKTNDISGNFLLRCGDGLVSQFISDLFNILFSGVPAKRLQAPVSRILSIGSASGSDILSGIVLSLQIHGGACFG
ncbi:MAG TPA: DUF2877 domain-containing protein [Clostridia bacterium]|nr:DUF2877 domain-containing protein [Clostridia bacterium]